MTLLQLSAQYRQSGDLLRARLRLLRRAVRCTTDPEELFWMQRRIATLSSMLRQVNELTELTQRYYERGYKRNEKYTL